MSLVSRFLWDIFVFVVCSACNMTGVRNPDTWKEDVVEEFPKANLQAYVESVRPPFGHVVKRIRDLLGPKLVAYIGGVTETRAVNMWVDGVQPKSPDVEDRVRLAAQLAGLIALHDNGAVAQAWFQGLNPQLGDRSPARLLREGDVHDIGPKLLAAARAFVVGG